MVLWEVGYIMMSITSWNNLSQIKGKHWRNAEKKSIDIYYWCIVSFFDKQIIRFFFQSKETLQYKETYKGHLYYLHKTPKSLRQDSELPYHEIQSKP